MADAAPVTFKAVRANPKVRHLIDGANSVMKAMGYTEHGHRHVGVVAGTTRYLLENLGHGPRYIELGQIAAHLHDIGNCVARLHHPMHGGAMAFTILDQMGMDMTEIAPILGAIGNHEELTGGPVSPMSAALILADKADVHFSRVQNPDPATYDIHDRVNAAVRRSRVTMDTTERCIQLELEIAPGDISVMHYFEIFLSRMVMCRESAAFVGCRFRLDVNGTVVG